MMLQEPYCAWTIAVGTFPGPLLQEPHPRPFVQEPHS